MDIGEHVATGAIGDPGRLARVDRAIGVQIDEHRPPGKRGLGCLSQAVAIEVVANRPLDRAHLGNEIAEIGGRGRAGGDRHGSPIARPDERKQAADGGTEPTGGDLEHGHRAGSHPGDPITAVCRRRCRRLTGVRDRVTVDVDEHRPAGDARLARLANAVLVAVLEHRSGDRAGDRGERHVRKVGRRPPVIADPHRLAVGEAGRRRESGRNDLHETDVPGVQPHDCVLPVDVGDGAPLPGVEDAIGVGVDEHRPACEPVLRRIVDPVAIGVVEDRSRNVADEHLPLFEALEMKRPPAPGGCRTTPSRQRESRAASPRTKSGRRATLSGHGFLIGSRRTWLEGEVRVPRAESRDMHEQGADRTPSRPMAPTPLSLHFRHRAP